MWWSMFVTFLCLQSVRFERLESLGLIRPTKRFVLPFIMFLHELLPRWYNFRLDHSNELPLGPLGTIGWYWEPIGNFGNHWNPLGIHWQPLGNTRNHLKLLGTIEQHWDLFSKAGTTENHGEFTCNHWKTMGTIRNYRKQLGNKGITWHYRELLESLGTIWKHLEPPDNSGTYGKII